MKSKNYFQKNRTFNLHWIALFLIFAFSCNNQSLENNKANDAKIALESNFINQVKKQDVKRPLIAEKQIAPKQIKTLPTSPSNEFISFKDFYKNFDKEAQTFTLNTERDTSFICSQGTKIKVKARSFETSTGQALTGEIKLKIKEFYKIEDILLANLSTMSNKGLLETGGMLYIEAIYNKEECVLKASHPIEISFPYEKEKDGMKLFIGNWGDEQIDWKEEVDSTYSESVETEIFYWQI